MARKAVKRVSMRDVAREAGVSVGSVSHILGGKADLFAEATVARVREIARRLNYRPNATARSLFTGSTKMAGVMVPASEFYSHVLDGLNGALLEHGHLMLHAWNPRIVSTPDDRTEALIVHQMIERAVDGIILRPSSEGFERRYFEEIWQRGIPLIVIDRELSLFRTDFVGTDDVQVGSDAARHLIDLGHRRLLFLGTQLECSTSRLRGQGFRDVVSASLDAACRSATLDDTPESIAAVKSMLNGPGRPTGVFCYSDVGAVVLLRIAEELGLRVPDDLSIIGCGNLSSAAQVTTFDQQPTAIGTEAAALYLDRVQNPAATDVLKTVRLPARLIQRHSTAPRPA